MPENSIYVGRPTKYGNPFKLISGMMFYFSVNRSVFSPWIIYDHAKSDYEPSDMVYFYEMWITGKLTTEIGLPEVPNIEDLRGKDLACWCAPTHYCHADILIKILET